MPHVTIGELYGAAQVGAKPLSKPAPPTAMGGAPGAKTGPNGQPMAIDQIAQKSQMPQMPEHELNVDHPTNMHDPEDAQNQYNFLKQAMGGPQEGFVTTTSKSHAVAHKLAKSGHLIKIQEAKLGNGHTKMHWQLTQKGVAAVGQTQNQAGRRR